MTAIIDYLTRLITHNARVAYVETEKPDGYRRRVLLVGLETRARISKPIAVAE